MTFIERVRSWFSPRQQGRVNQQQRDPWLDKQQYTQAVGVIRQEHEQLARKTYWLGGFSWWYRLLGKEPRVRTTIAQQASTMDSKSVSRFLGRVHDEIRVHSSLPWWKRLFTKGPSRRDQHLLCYLGAQRYLSSNLESKPFEAIYRRSFLPMLCMRGARNNRWYICFSSADRLRNLNWSRKEAATKEMREAQELKQKLQEARSQVKEAKKQVLITKAWSEITWHCVTSSAAIKSPVLATVALVAHNAAVSANKLVRSVEASICLANEHAFKIQRDSGTSTPLNKLKREIIETSAEVVEASRGVVSIGLAAKKEGNLAVKALAGVAEERAKAAKLRNKNSKARLIAKQQKNIGRLEQRARELLRWERELRGLSKLHRRYHPRTENDIYRMWGEIFRGAEISRVSHLLPQSAIIQEILPRSQIVSSIFRSQWRRSSSGKDKGCCSWNPSA